MRYTIGQVYVFGYIKFQQTIPSFFRIYRPWEDELQGVEFVALRCVEHHKVTNGYTDEKDYDGFIFEMVSSTNPDRMNVKRWHNQYPVAAYSQTSTDQDYYVYPSELLSGKSPAATFRDVQVVLQTIYDGVVDKNFQKPEMKNEKAALVEWYDSLATVIRVLYGLKAEIKPWIPGLNKVSLTRTWEIQ